MNSSPEDSNLWLEEISGDKALAWARQQNQRSQTELEAVPGFALLRDRISGILDSKEKIPFVGKHGSHYYNFWRDEVHPRGLWRRTSLAEYRKEKPTWEIVLDLDALARQEKENWVWGGADCLYPKQERCLISLSRGGADASVVREFDTATKQFIEGGFTLPEAKSSVTWKDLDTLYVGTDFGPDSLTDSGYPRLLKEWRRGTRLAEAKLLYEGQKSDIAVGGFRSWDHGHVRDFISRAITFFTSETFLRDGDKLIRIEVPIDADVETWDDQLLIRLRSNWKIGDKTWPEGAYLGISLEDFLKGERGFHMLFTPSANRSFAGASQLKSALIVNELEDVRNRLYVLTKKDGHWRKTELMAGAFESVSASPIEARDSDDYWVISTGFVRPTTLSFATLGKAPEALKTSPTFFNANDLIVEQHFAISKDGTRIPYFQLAKSNLVLDGNNPTLLNGYGGFEVSMTPYYDALTGVGWSEAGGVYVVANIRGGGEYGPAWHQAALKHNRQRAYDDFIAVAEDLVRRKVTSPHKLGIEGGSNGGLLMGVMLTQRPDLFGAIVCSVPLLDMKRYHKLLAGASWMAEYGDPDQPEDWAALSKFSPYQNVKRGVKYPRTLFTTSTRDDRVHPGHARKMVARMLEQGHDLLYYENIEGGHGGAANNAQRAYLSTLSFIFLKKQLGLAP